jgi:hypothetical protein
MAITIDNTTVPSRVGPGYVIYFHTSLATVPTDVYYAQVNSPGFNFICAGSALQFNPGVGHVVLGLLVAPFTNVGLVEDYLAPGATVGLQLAVTHANGISFDNLVSPGWIWDPTGGLFILAARAAQATVAGGILQTTYKNNP